MPWEKTAADRQRDAQVYGSAEYKRNRAAAWKRADGRCEQLVDGRRCGSRKDCQVDHIVNAASGGGHHLDNLHVLCRQHHAEKTAREANTAKRRRRSDPPLQARTNWLCVAHAACSMNT